MLLMTRHYGRRNFWSLHWHWTSTTLHPDGLLTFHLQKKFSHLLYHILQVGGIDLSDGTDLSDSN